MTARRDFHALRIGEVRRESADAVSIRLDVPPDLADIFAFAPGQYLTLRAMIDGEDVRRTYSICASPLDGELRVAVRMLPGGRFSRHANAMLKAGEAIDVLAPAGRFTWRFARGTQRRYAAFVAGSGITPVLSLIRTALMTEAESRFTLFYGNRSTAQILFLEDLAALKNRFIDRLEVYHFLTMEEEDIALFNGRLDRAKCDAILSTLIDPAAVDAFFLCGPEGMMDAAGAALHAAGVPSGRILLERFAAAGVSAAVDERARATVEAAAGRRMGVILDGRRLTVAFDAEAGNILDSVRRTGAPAPYACKGGVCATCRAKVIAGDVTMRLNYGLSAAEVAQGYVLTCQAAPAGDDVVVSYDD